mgnify:CR=1 FL=1
MSEAYIECWKTLTINKLNPELSFMILEELFGHKNEFEEYFNTIMIKLTRECGKSVTGTVHDSANLKLLRVPPFGIKSASSSSKILPLKEPTSSVSEYESTNGSSNTPH